MPGSDTCPKLGARLAARSIGQLGDVTKRRNKQGLVAQPRRFAEPLLGPGKYLDDVGLSGSRETVAEHLPGRVRLRRGASSQLSDEILELVARNVVIAA